MPGRSRRGRRFRFETNEPGKCFAGLVSRYEEHRRPLKRSFRRKKKAPFRGPEGATRGQAAIRPTTAVEAYLPGQKKAPIGGAGGGRSGEGAVSSSDGAPAEDGGVDEEQDDGAEDRADPACGLFFVAEHRGEEASDERAGDAEED